MFIALGNSSQRVARAQGGVRAMSGIAASSHKRRGVAGRAQVEPRSEAQPVSNTKCIGSVYISTPDLSGLLRPDRSILEEPVQRFCADGINKLDDLRSALTAGLESGPAKSAGDVFDRLETKYRDIEEDPGQ